MSGFAEIYLNPQRLSNNGDTMDMSKAVVKVYSFKPKPGQVVKAGVLMMEVINVTDGNIQFRIISGFERIKRLLAKDYERTRIIPMGQERDRHIQKTKELLQNAG